MAVRRYLRKRRRKAEGRATPTFIQAEGSQHDHAEGNTFFHPAEGIQAKLNVSQPGDPQEMEADHMADKVVHKRSTDAAVSRVAKDDEKMSRRGKEEDDKMHKKEKDEDEKKIHKKDKDEEDKKIHKKGKDEEEHVATKQASPGAHAPVGKPAIPKSGGESLPPSTQAEMSSSFGFDFSKVRIHKNEEAHQLNEQLQAQAFTHGGDVYFNKDKFNPHTEAGKWLLAHELTHVVQQKGPDEVQKKDVSNISTPVPEDFTLNLDKKKEVESAQGKINGVTVIIKRDTRGPVEAGSQGHTSFDMTPSLPKRTIVKGKIATITGDATVLITIRTQYRPGADTKVTSAYGRGTTEADKAAGNTSLRFHEGSHGLDYMGYVQNNPLPAFEGKVGMTVAEYNDAIRKFDKALHDYKDAIEAADTAAVECVGKPASFCKH
ncbi:DUF4157 domain-containing protein [Chryseolinea soli]|uniref:DUF4157 domain-containing protein n=1 Tax=Chryseolinea soli TaxID=2321403 RepID=A0A385SUM2_9BACT|nr:DUF4157 domain-containing protein [Chryseolinea soli]AYB34001.1 DUF4157 domain-containing protein [Chryseolinea soli]